MNTIEKSVKFLQIQLRYEVENGRIIDELIAKKLTMSEARVEMNKNFSKCLTDLIDLN
jgi:hypothetical protein